MRVARHSSADGRRTAFRVDLPPPADRPNPGTVPCVGRWNLVLPGDHAFWNRYTLLACSLADFPGVPPAHRRFPEATHEISLFAVNPDYPDDHFRKGGISVLEPVNYVEQFTTTDASCAALAEHLAGLLVRGKLAAEPQGIRGAREAFREAIDRFLAGGRSAGRRRTD